MSQVAGVVPGVEQYRSRLFGVAYRMLGDAHEAEDLVQECYLRWHRAGHEPVDAPEAWLVAVVTRLSVDHLRHRAVERRACTRPWLTEPMLTPPGGAASPDAPDRAVELASDLSVALLVLLERLAPEERAAFLLRDVFDAGYDAIARVLDRNTVAIRQLVHRARERVRTGRSHFASAPGARARLLDRFLAVLAADDQDALLALFEPAAPASADGRDDVPAPGRVLAGPDRLAALPRAVERKAAGRLAHRRAWPNGEPTTGSDVCVPGEPRAVLPAPTPAGNEAPGGTPVRAVYRVLDPDTLRSVARA